LVITGNHKTIENKGREQEGRWFVDLKETLKRERSKFYRCGIRVL
jgi:hypothetical protein